MQGRDESRNHKIKAVRLRRSIILLFLLICFSCSGKRLGEVVVYTSLDQIFSEPILKHFEDATSIKVRALYDTEATKTVGLTNRLIAEKDNPKADVFWSSEILHTIRLKREDILAPYISPNAQDIPASFKDLHGFWTGFAARARVILVNRKLLANMQSPHSIRDLVDPRWKGMGGFSFPMFGTGNTHALALFHTWGIQPATNFFEQCVKNQVHVLDGNSVVRDRIVSGDIVFGLVDTDDAYQAILKGHPVEMIYPDQDEMGTLLIPNTVALIAHAPHPQSARKLIDYLLSETVEETLAFSGSLQIPLRAHIKRPSDCPSLTTLKVFTVDFESLAERADEYSKVLRMIFVK